jgi:outer membrane protein W
VSLPFAKYYTIALNGEADVTQTVGTFTELLTTAKYPLIKEKVLFSPYVGLGYSYGFSTGTTVGATGGVARFGFNAPVTLSKNWELNFQVETDFSHQLNGLVWYGARITCNF